MQYCCGSIILIHFKLHRLRDAYLSLLVFDEADVRVEGARDVNASEDATFREYEHQNGVDHWYHAQEPCPVSFADRSGEARRD